MARRRLSAAPPRRRLKDDPTMVLHAVLRVTQWSLLVLAVLLTGPLLALRARQGVGARRLVDGHAPLGRPCTGPRRLQGCGGAGVCGPRVRLARCLLRPHVDRREGCRCRSLPPLRGDRLVRRRQPVGRVGLVVPRAGRRVVRRDAAPAVRCARHRCAGGDRRARARHRALRACAPLSRMAGPQQQHLRRRRRARDSCACI